MRRVMLRDEAQFARRRSRFVDDELRFDLAPEFAEDLTVLPARSLPMTQERCSARLAPQYLRNIPRTTDNHIFALDRDNRRRRLG